MKIALIQEKAIPNNPEINLILATTYIEKAQKQGADLVLFPEMWSNGYAPPFPEAFDFPTDSTKEKERQTWLNQGIAADDDFIKTIQKTAQTFSIGVVITCLRKHHNKITNSAFLINREGAIIMDYDKVHTCDFSLECLIDSGTEFKVVEFDDINIGIMICYDREFPESARELMLKGAELILVPNACDMNPARLHQLSTRAFENMVGVAMSNYPGDNWGGSVAYSPIVFDDNGRYLDNTLLLMDDTTEGMSMVDFDMEAIRDFRKKETWGNAYRKVKAYSSLTSNIIKEPFLRDNPKIQ